MSISLGPTVADTARRDSRPAFLKIRPFSTTFPRNFRECPRPGFNGHSDCPIYAARIALFCANGRIWFPGTLHCTENGLLSRASRAAEHHGAEPMSAHETIECWRRGGLQRSDCECLLAG